MHIRGINIVELFLPVWDLIVLKNKFFAGYCDNRERKLFNVD